MSSDPDEIDSSLNNQGLPFVYCSFVYLSTYLLWSSVHFKSLKPLFMRSAVGLGGDLHGGSFVYDTFDSVELILNSAHLRPPRNEHGLGDDF